MISSPRATFPETPPKWLIICSISHLLHNKYAFLIKSPLRINHKGTKPLAGQVPLTPNVWMPLIKRQPSSQVLFKAGVVQLSYIDTSSPVNNLQWTVAQYDPTVTWTYLCKNGTDRSRFSWKDLRPVLLTEDLTIISISQKLRKQAQHEFKGQRMM